MSQEIANFEFFKQNQLVSVDFATGVINAQSTNRWGHQRIHPDIGHISHDGYIRIYCGRKLRMKHRFLFWLFHGYLPAEVDHEDGVRDNNSISNLVASDRSRNTTGKQVRSYTRLTDVQVHALCVDLKAGVMSITALAKKYGRSRVQIKAILSKKYWSQISDQYF